MSQVVLLVHGGAGRAESEVAGSQREGIGRALAAGWSVLERGGGALDAVSAAVVVLEDDPHFNAGVGSCLTLDGTVEMDASIMDGAERRAGAAALLRTVLNPVRLARAIMEDGRHVLLAGEGAERFARERALPIAPPEHFVTERQRERWRARRSIEAGTVGAVAVDGNGHVAAATSTGGVMPKLPGRIGDSAVIGAGTFADDSAGAASATGHGESILLGGLARAAVDGLRDGTHPQDAARRAVRQLAACARGRAGVILVDRFGRFGWARNAEHMLVGRRDAGGVEITV